MNSGYRFGECEFQPGARRLWIGGTEVVLGGRALDLLHALVANHERVLSKRDLFDLVWPGVAVEPNNLQVQVWVLRKLLGRSAIATVARRGYRFMLPVEPIPAIHVQARQALTSSATSDMVQVLAAQVRRHRLTTLVGIDDAARLTLSQAVVQALAGTLAGGIWQTQAAVLATSIDENGPDAVASRLLHVLLQRVARKVAVVVVHGCHHVLGGVAPAVQALLSSAPKLHVLATGQAPLGLRIETVVTVTPQTAAHAPASAPVASWGPRGHVS